MMKLQKKIKNFLINLSLFITSTLLCFIVLEYVFSNFVDTSNYRIKDKLFDPVVGWRSRPGTYRVKPPHAFKKHDIYINKFGLRNRDIAAAEQNVFKILVLGDSFTIGRAVKNRHLFTTQLERLLNQNSGGYEVINAGVPGYGTSQEYLLMQQLEKKMSWQIFTYLWFIQTISLIIYACHTAISKKTRSNPALRLMNVEQLF